MSSFRTKVQILVHANFICVSPRVNQASQDSQEVQDSKGVQDHQVSLDCREVQVLKATLVCPDYKVNLQERL